MLGQGASDDLARTVAVNAITIGQIFYLLNSRHLVASSAISLHVWPWLLLAGFVFFVVVELEKLVIRLLPGLRRAVTSVEAGSPATRAAAP